MPATKVSTKKPGTPKPSKVKARMSVTDVMRELKKAGSAQAKKTYTRHGALEPMFGVSFATLKVLMKRIGVDHELALALWDTRNFDARNLALKIVDPVRMTSADLDRWAREMGARMCCGYVAMIAAEGPHGAKKVAQWLASGDDKDRCHGWSLLGQLAQRDETTPDAFFEKRLAEIVRSIHAAPNAEREGMNQAVIAIGCRSQGLRKAAIAAAKRIGKVEIDHGDTYCKTPDAVEYIEKCWAHSKSKGFESPAAQERSRETPRRRC
ncbi:MAG: DNA alkylation repair protein [Planctomycetota bacterium]